MISSPEHEHIGPHVIDGHLFFHMLDGSTISCNCISSPYAEQIVALWEELETRWAKALHEQENL